MNGGHRMNGSRDRRSGALWAEGASDTRSVRRGVVYAVGDSHCEFLGPAQSMDHAVDANTETAHEVAFTIVDDSANQSVYKGPGSYAATRGETAMRAVEAAFKPLRFDLRFERDLTALHASAPIHASTDKQALLVVLLSALTSTGTRLAPEKRVAGAN